MEAGTALAGEGVPRPMEEMEVPATKSRVSFTFAVAAPSRRKLDEMSAQSFMAMYLVGLVFCCYVPIFALGPRLAFSGSPRKDEFHKDLFWLQQACSAVFLILYGSGLYAARSRRLTRKARIGRRKASRRVGPTSSQSQHGSKRGSVSQRGSGTRGSGTSQRWPVPSESRRKSSGQMGDVLKNTLRGAARMQSFEHPANVATHVVLATLVPMVFENLALAKSRSHFKWVGCLRLLHVWSFNRALNMLESNLVVPYWLPPLLRNFLTLITTTHFVACALWLQARHKHFSDSTWVGVYRTEDISATAATQYVTSLYFSCVTMSGVGYGDITAVSSTENLILVGYIFINIFILANIVGAVSALAALRDTDLAAKRSQISRFERMLGQESISPAVASATLEYLRLGLRMSNTLNDSDINTLPESVRLRIREERFGRLVRSRPFFRGASSYFLARCVSCVREDAYVKDQTVIRCGDMASCRACVLLDGYASIDIEHDKPKDELARRGSDVASTADESDTYTYSNDDQSQTCSVALLTSGAVFGAESFLTASPEPWTVTARTLLRVISLDQKDQKELEQAFPNDWFRLRSNLLHSTIKLHKNAEMLAQDFTRRSLRRGVDEGEKLDESVISRASEDGGDGADVKHVTLHEYGLTLEHPSNLKYPDTMDKFAANLTDVRVALERAEARSSHEVAALFCHLASIGDQTELERLCSLVPMEAVRGDYDGRTGLHLAAAGGHVDAVTLLLDHKAPINAMDRFGRTPLHEAVKSGNSQIIKLLRSRGANLSLPEEEIAGILCQAAESGDITCVRNYCDAGANPNSADYDKRTGLMLAAASGNTKIVSFLLARGADADFTDRWGRTAADEARSYGHTGTILEILTHPPRPGVAHYLERRASSEKKLNAQSTFG